MVMRKSIVKFALVSVLALVGTFHSYAQSSNKTDWNNVLDRYDEICSQCMTLRENVQQGKQVSASKVTSLFQELSQLRNALQDASGSMTNDQKRRFTEIRNRYQTYYGDDGDETDVGVTNTEHTKSAVPVEPETNEKSIPFEFDTNPAPLSIPAAIIELQDFLSARRVGTGPVFTELPEQTPKTDWQIHVMGMMEFGQVPSYGLSLAFGKRRYGLVISALSNFRNISYDYECLSNGNIPGVGHFWGDGNVAVSRFSLSAGAYWAASENILIYGNAGYGNTCHCWRDTKGRWAHVTDISGSGVLIGMGGILSIRHLSLTTGLQYNSYEHSVRFNAGIGCRF